MGTDKNAVELLAPAGNKEALEAAVNAGADAVYIGLGRFNARRRAGNFEGAVLRDAVEFAHLRDVKVYAALNTLIRDSEFEDFAATVEEACSAGIDAAILQDWGAAKMVRELAPSLRLHASTQMNSHNSPVLDILEGKGFERVTLARELSLEEVRKLVEEHSIEVEVFAHGALCFSYSGQCLISSMVSGRSGNRGLCPQVCRLSYRLCGGSEELPAPGKHILSTRDLCTLTSLGQLAEAGVTSLKLEGRMKSARYVGTVTGVYRRALDLASAGEYEVSEEEIDELKIAFNRGFTEGYLKGIKDESLMSFGRPSDRGVMAGRVAFTDVFTGDVGIALQRPIALNDVLEVWVSRGGRVRQKVGGLTVGGGPVEAAPPGARAVVKFEEKRHHIANGDRVFIVERERAAGGEKRIPIELDVALAVGEPLKVTASSGGVSCRVRGDARAEKARTKPVTLDLLERQLGKLGDAAYRIKKLDARIDGAPMLSVSEINEVRRRFVADLDQRRLSPYRARPCPAPHDAKHFFERTLKGRSVKRETALVGLHVSASDIEASVACVGAGADRIYLRVQGGSGALDHNSRKVIREHPEIRPAFGNIAKDVELEGILADAIGIWGGGVALCDNLGLSRLLLESGFEAVLDYHINVLNSLTAMDLAESAYSGFTASVEADSEDIAGLVRMSPVPVETIVHGAIEVMTAEHPVAVRKKTEGLAPYEIVDPKDFRFPVVLDERARTHIYNSKDLCLLEELPAVLATGVSSIRLQLELYAPARARAVVEVYRRALAEIQAIGEVGDGTLAKAATVHNSFSDHTTGHFYRPVL